MPSLPTLPPCELAVIGGGSGGFAAALAAARRGVRVVLIEPGAILGGTSTLGGVNTWEPGVAGPGIPAELYDRLARIPSQIGVSRTVKHWTHDQPWGRSHIDRSLVYRDTLRRSGREAEAWFRATFEPAAMAGAMAALLGETGKVTCWLGARCVGAEASGDAVTAVILATASGEMRLPTRFVIDATGNLAVCTALGCRTYLGAESQQRYGEPSAPETHLERLNGVTVCMRVTPAAQPAIEPLPSGVPAEFLSRPISITQYPCGDLNLNPLPVMEGMEYHRLGPEEGRRQCVERVWRIWHWLQVEKGFQDYRLAMLFPLVGVREGPRLIGRRVLTEEDVRRGCSAEMAVDRRIALADHALDVHGEGHLCRELSEPYGIPYECLLPQEMHNLAVACRGASFSHIAAASCRLSRTMMGLGHAAGLAVAAALHEGTRLPDVNLARVRAWLDAENVALTPEDPRLPGV
jgi:hypothetical protein